MKLSDLVQFLNYLDEYDLETHCTDGLDPFGNVTSMVYSSTALDQSLKDPVRQSFKDVENSMRNFQKSIKELRQKIMHQIMEIEKTYFLESTELHTKAMRRDSVQHIIKRSMSLTDQAAAIFEQRLKIYVSWQHPGLVFRPIHMTSLPELVALDPMYLVDTHEALLIPSTQQFNDNYQRRVRNYLLDDYSDEPFLSDLPREQFGLVAAQNFLNFKPIEVVTRIVHEVYDLLRPGGGFVFTYNNCDYAGPVKLVENHFTCYTPGRLIKEQAIKSGYIINYEFNEINGASILELRKPGSKVSLRGGQTLAVIKDGVEAAADTVVKSKSKSTSVKSKILDRTTTKLYNDDERQRIQLTAVIVGIGTEKQVTENYPIEVLEQEVDARLNRLTKDNRDKIQKRLEKLIHKRKTQ